MFSTRDILLIAGLPFGVTLVVLFVAWRPWRRREKSGACGYWGAPFGISVGFLAAFALLEGRPPAWPPAEARHWLFYFVAALAVLGMLESLLHAWHPAAGWLRAEAVLLVIAAGMLQLFRSILGNDTWLPFEAARNVLGMTILAHAAWASTEVLVLRLPRPAGPLAVAAFCGSVGLVVMLSGSLVYGRLAAALACAALGAAVVAIPAVGFTLARGGVTVLVPAATAILLLARHYVDPGVTSTNAALLFAALGLPWLATLRSLRRRKAWVRTLLALLLAAVPAAVAVALAQRSFAHMQQETGPDPYATAGSGV